MKLTGELKAQVEKAETKDEKKILIENAGMLLNDDELEMVSGGNVDANPLHAVLTGNEVNIIHLDSHNLPNEKGKI